MFKTTINNTTTTEPAPEASEYKMFIGCIPGTASDEDILTVLSKIGDIKSLKLERRKNNKCSGYGFATVTSKSVYESLLKSKPQFGDRQLSVLPYLEKKDLVKSQLKFNKRRIVVAQLPHHATEKDLETHFKPFGEIEKTFIVHNENETSLLPYGHVVFKNETGASKARSVSTHFICGKRVAIKVHKINVQKKLGTEQSQEFQTAKNMHVKKQIPYQQPRNNKPLENRVKNLSLKSKVFNHPRPDVRKIDFLASFSSNRFNSSSNPQVYPLVTQPVYGREALTQVLDISKKIEKVNHFVPNLRMN